MSNRKHRDKNRATARGLIRQLVNMDGVKYGIGAMKGEKRIKPSDMYIFPPNP